MNFKEQMAGKVAEIEEILKAYMPKEEGYQRNIMESMNYSLNAGGKRLRPILTIDTYKLFKSSKETDNTAGNAWCLNDLDNCYIEVVFATQNVFKAQKIDIYSVMI